VARFIQTLCKHGIEDKRKVNSKCGGIYLLNVYTDISDMSLRYILHSLVLTTKSRKYPEVFFSIHVCVSIDIFQSIFPIPVLHNFPVYLVVVFLNVFF
jgi:hypothetical protein